MTIFSFMSVGWGQFDITPPELVNIEVLTDSVDISNEPQSVFVNLTVSDDMSGFSSGQIIGQSPGGSDNTDWNLFTGSGELFLEISNLELVVPTEVEPGEWTFWLILYDVSGNQFIDFSIGSFQVFYGESLCDEETEVELWGECYNIEETTSLYLDNSGLTGEIPSEIGNLTNLTYLYLNGNELTGEIPSTIGNLTNLTYLWLHSNQLTGEIPSTIGNLTNLTRLYLSSNQLTGEIPSDIWELTNLTGLVLYSNQLIGEIPPEIGNLTNLQMS
jgi:hypothetical protein